MILKERFIATFTLWRELQIIQILRSPVASEHFSYVIYKCIMWKFDVLTFICSLGFDRWHGIVDWYENLSFI